MLHKQSSHTIESLKWIAIFTMVIDHIGLVLLDNNEILRAIGRIAFPLFSYILIHNYIYYTSNKKNYIKRLLIFGVISQPFSFLTLGGLFNIFILLGIVLLVIYFIEKIQHRYYDKKYIQIILQFYLILLGSTITLFTGYGLVGYFFLLLLYLSFKSPKYYFLPLLAIILLQIDNFIYLIGVYSSIGILYLTERNPFPIVRSNKWFFYIFYPVHLYILFLLKVFI